MYAATNWDNVSKRYEYLQSLARFCAGCNWWGSRRADHETLLGRRTQRYGWRPTQTTDHRVAPAELQPLENVSLIGKHYQQDESSTAALGRILYTALMGQPPASKEAKTVMSYLVHYVISMVYAGAYSVIRGQRDDPDLDSGLAMVTSLWLFGDELFMPLAGLTKGPTAYPVNLHLHSWGRTLPTVLAVH